VETIEYVKPLSDVPFIDNHTPFQAALDNEISGQDKDSAADKTVFLAVMLGKLGVRRKVSSSIVDTDADKSLLYVSKEILDSPELKSINSLDNEIRAYLKGRCLPVAFRRGFHVLPLSLLKEVDAKLQEFKDRRSTLVDAFIAVYQERVDEAKEKLAGLFVEADYPAVEAVAKAFKMEIRYTNFGISGTLREVSKEIYDREKAEIAGELREAVEDAIVGLRIGFQEMVETLVDRLGNKEDGKPKSFKGPTIDKIKDFLSVFECRNISNDGELEKLVSSAKLMLDGVDPAILRKDLDVRGSVKQGMESILDELKTLTLTDSVSRKYSLSDPDEESNCGTNS
jgi:hypothetical protein